MSAAGLSKLCKMWPNRLICASIMSKIPTRRISASEIPFPVRDTFGGNRFYNHRMALSCRTRWSSVLCGRSNQNLASLSLQLVSDSILSNTNTISCFCFGETISVSPLVHSILPTEGISHFNKLDSYLFHIEWKRGGKNDREMFQNNKGLDSSIEQKKPNRKYFEKNVYILKLFLQ